MVAFKYVYEDDNDGMFLYRHIFDSFKKALFRPVRGNVLLGVEHPVTRPHIHLTALMSGERRLTVHWNRAETPTFGQIRKLAAKQLMDNGAITAQQKAVLLEGSPLEEPHPSRKVWQTTTLKRTWKRPSGATSHAKGKKVKVATERDSSDSDTANRSRVPSSSS